MDKSGTYGSIKVVNGTDYYGVNGITLQQGLWCINTSIMYWNAVPPLITIGISNGSANITGGTGFLASNVNSAIPNYTDWTNSTGYGQRVTHCNFIYNVTSSATFTSCWICQLSNGTFNFQYATWATKIA